LLSIKLKDNGLYYTPFEGTKVASQASKIAGDTQTDGQTQTGTQTGSKLPQKHRFIFFKMRKVV
jgi:hypothetical protein